MSAPNAEKAPYPSRGDYYVDKSRKLAQQQRAEVSATSGIFTGVAAWVDGVPGALELREMLLRHGGRWEHFPVSGVTHIIAINLPSGKVRDELSVSRRSYVVVTPAWLIDSVKAGRQLPPADYALEQLHAPGQQTLNRYLARSKAAVAGKTTTTTTTEAATSATLVFASSSSPCFVALCQRVCDSLPGCELCLFNARQALFRSPDGALAVEHALLAEASCAIAVTRCDSELHAWTLRAGHIGKPQLAPAASLPLAPWDAALGALTCADVRAAASGLDGAIAAVAQGRGSCMRALPPVAAPSQWLAVAQALEPIDDAALDRMWARLAGRAPVEPGWCLFARAQAGGGKELCRLAVVEDEHGRDALGALVGALGAPRQQLRWLQVQARLSDVVAASASQLDAESLSALPPDEQARVKADFARRRDGGGVLDSAAAAAVPTPPAEWACAACTLLNPAGAVACAACGAAAPVAAAAGASLFEQQQRALASLDETALDHLPLALKRDLLRQRDGAKPKPPPPPVPSQPARGKKPKRTASPAPQAAVAKRLFFPAATAPPSPPSSPPPPSLPKSPVASPATSTALDVAAKKATTPPPLSAAELVDHLRAALDDECSNACPAEGDGLLLARVAAVAAQLVRERRLVACAGLLRHALRRRVTPCAVHGGPCWSGALERLVETAQARALECMGEMLRL